MKAKSSMRYPSARYESPETEVIALETEGVICDSSITGNTDSFEEKSDWPFNW